MIISKDEIFIILNENYLSRKFEIDIRYPLYNISLFTLNTKNFRVYDIVEKSKIDGIRRKIKADEFIKRDLPRYEDIVDAFISSGALDFENQDSIDEEFKLLKKAMQDKTVYIKPLFIGIDTNIAYYRIISRRLKDSFKYAVSQIVVDEIDARIHTKYSGKMLRSFENLANNSIISEFANASSKEARKAKNAMNEINYMFDTLDSFRTGESTTTMDKEARDREIALQYHNFAKEVEAEVVILTADKDMSFHAQAQGISSIYFKLPHKVWDLNIDPMRIPYLLYDLAVNFGVIQLNDTIILSEWRGKEVEDYLKENLKIYNVNKELAKDISLCRGDL